MKFIGNPKLMATSLPNLIDNPTEGINKIKCEDCDCFLEYESVKESSIKFKSVSYNKDYSNIIAEELKNKIQEKQTKAERSNGNRSYSERVRAKLFCCAFKLGFLQLIWKASLIFKSNLELALSIILKQRELYESKHVSEECRCLKI